MTSIIAGIPDFKKLLESTKKNIDSAAKLAINSVARSAYTELKRKIKNNVNLSEAYLNGRDFYAPRLQITQFAREGELEAVIKGRQRATSLMRFGAKEIKGQGVQVKVGKKTKMIKKAYVVKFKNGNRALALRLKKGQKVKNKRVTAVPFSSSKNTDAYLLYGPSVQQLVSRLAPEMVPWIEKKLVTEFNRQMVRLNAR